MGIQEKPSATFYEDHNTMLRAPPLFSFVIQYTYQYKRDKTFVLSNSFSEIFIPIEYRECHNPSYVLNLSIQRVNYML